MADKLLKSITFPDLTDKYIIGDTSLSVAGAGADAKATGDALATKAEVDGSYESMTVGNAEQLVSNVRVNDKTPYLFRTSGGSVDIGDREYVNGIVGGTVAWNQLVENGNFASVSNWSLQNASYTVANNVATITATRRYGGIQQYEPIATGHKVLMHCEVKPSSTAQEVTVYCYKGNSYFVMRTNNTTAWTSCSKIIEMNGSDASCAIVVQESTETIVGSFDAKNVQVFDLTQMFGSTIADYIYSLETATAGAGVAWFKKLFNKPYYAYNAGELKSVSGLVSHDMTGFNQWDEEWELGGIGSSNGTPYSSNTLIRSKNFCRCLGGLAYYCKGTYAVVWYDTDKNFIQTDYAGNNIKTAPANAEYFKIAFYEAYGTTYKGDCCINISWDGSRNGEYEPYELHSYPLDSDLTLRGIPKLDANNNLYYDGDTYESDGTVTRKYGIVDMGSLTWYKYTSSTDYGTIFYTEDIASAVAKMVAIHSVCSKYVTYPNSYNGVIGTANSMPDKAMRIHNETGRVYVRDESISGTGADFKNSVNGVYLVYELATPTTETADPYQQTQVVNDFGTEEYVIDSNTFAVPVGSDTDYPVNLVAKLEMAPNSPDGSGDYIVRQTNGVNEYVPLVIEDALPTIPSTAGSYKLTVTVADGVDPVLSWEAE